MNIKFGEGGIMSQYLGAFIFIFFIIVSLKLCNLFVNLQIKLLNMLT